MRDLNETLIVVIRTDEDGEEHEIEIDPYDIGGGNLTSEAALSLAIGGAVRKALMETRDGEPVEVRAYAR